MKLVYTLASVAVAVTAPDGDRAHLLTQSDFVFRKRKRSCSLGYQRNIDALYRLMDLTVGWIENAQIHLDEAQVEKTIHEMQTLMSQLPIQNTQQEKEQ